LPTKPSLNKIRLALSYCFKLFFVFPYNPGYINKKSECISLKIEKQNPEISVNVWEWEERMIESVEQVLKCVIYSKNYDRKHIIHLIALSELNGEITDFKFKHHYIWVKDVNKLLYRDTAYKGKKHFCNKCTQTFPCKERLDTRCVWCYGIDNTPQKVHSQRRME
jgi:hypothetical protein